MDNKYIYLGKYYERIPLGGFRRNFNDSVKIMMAFLRDAAPCSLVNIKDVSEKLTVPTIIHLCTHRRSNLKSHIILKYILIKCEGVDFNHLALDTDQ